MANLRKHILALALGCLSLGNFADAWADDKDFATDVNVEVEKDITKKWGIGVGGELRMNNNSTSVDKLAASVGSDYELTKWLKIGAGYEFINDWNGPEKDFFTRRHRWNVSASYKHKFTKRINAGLKLKYQQTFRSEEYKTYSQPRKDYVRAKIDGEYKIKGMPLYTHLSAEMFYFCNSNDGNTIDDIRYNAGVTYKINKHNSVDLSFQIDDEMNVSNPEDRFMLCASYKYKF